MPRRWTCPSLIQQNSLPTNGFKSQGGGLNHPPPPTFSQQKGLCSLSNHWPSLPPLLSSYDSMQETQHQKAAGPDPPSLAAFPQRSTFCGRPVTRQGGSKPQSSQFGCSPRERELRDRIISIKLRRNPGIF